MFENQSINKVLILAPHTDDGEFGCGATIAKFISQGKEVFYVSFSSCEESVPDGLPIDILSKEVKEATELLGIKSSNLILLNYSVRKFPEFRQQILEDMVKLNKQINPDLVFLPSTNDTHQDHSTISNEGFRAFKKTTILGYEVPWNNLSFTTNTFSMLNEEHLLKKINALKCYKSQAHRTYANEEFIRSLAITRGTQIGGRYAESFELIRAIIK